MAELLAAPLWACVDPRLPRGVGEKVVLRKVSSGETHGCEMRGVDGSASSGKTWQHNCFSPGAAHFLPFVHPPAGVYKSVAELTC
jgi:hypothetical protein